MSYFKPFSLALLLALSLSVRPTYSDGNTDLVTTISQRFYQFQNATSAVKQAGHGDPKILNAALNTFMSFIAPNFVSWQYQTIINFGFTTLAEIRNGYYEFATVAFNGWSQHFATNVVVQPGPSALQVLMTAGGGEWASLGYNTNTPNEQLTISNWQITWIWLQNGPTGPNWYIYNYLEIGNRLSGYCPAQSEWSLLYARQFPGDLPEATVSALCPAPQASAKTAALAHLAKAKVLGSKVGAR